MRGVEIGLTQFGMRFRVEADGAHEAQRLGDPVGKLLIALRLRAVLDETEHPAMHVFEIGVAAAGEGAQKVQRRRRLAIGLQLPARIGNARFRAEADVIDDVAAIGGQGDAVDGLVVGGARLGELPGDAADLDDRRGRRESHHHRHLQEDAEEISDVVGRMLAETLGAIAALQQERLSRLRLRQRALELARLAGENQRRIGGERALRLGERGGLGISRRLRDRLRPPALRAPAIWRHDTLFLRLPAACSFCGFPPRGGL